MTAAHAEHPAPRAIATVNNAAQIAQMIYERVRTPADAARIVELLKDAVVDVAAVINLLDQYQIDLRELRNEGLRMAQEVTEARQARADVIELLESAKLHAYRRIDVAAAEHETINALYTKLVPPAERTYPRPRGVLLPIDEPRAIAAGGS